MAIVYMVRHGKAAAGFDGHPDPGLDAVGREQAVATAEALAPLGPLPIYSSPLARARETAAPLAALWDVTPEIESRVAEIPSPTDDLRERARWLGGIMGERWSSLPQELHAWRRDMIECVAGYTGDCVVFCHFIAINVVVGAATGAEAMISFRPDNGSVTRIGVEEGRLGLIELGAEGATRVN